MCFADINFKAIQCIVKISFSKGFLISKIMYHFVAIESVDYFATIILCMLIKMMINHFLLL